MIKLISKEIISFTIAFVAIFLIQSCNNSTATLTNSNTASVQLKLVDAPGDYDQVNVNIIDIQYNNTDTDSGWTSFNLENTPIQIDLTKLVAGNDLLLANQLIPAGNFNQIRLILGDGNTLKINGIDNLVPLDTPSALQSGLKLTLNTTLQAGYSYTFILDWDVQKSIVSAGTSGKYNLKPVIRVNAEVNSGSISGNVVEVVNNVDIPVPGATVSFVNSSDENDSGSTLTDDNGYYLIQGLKAGDYNIYVEKTDYQTSDPLSVAVTVGNTITADKITLTKSTTTP